MSDLQVKLFVAVSKTTVSGLANVFSALLGLRECEISKRIVLD